MTSTQIPTHYIFRIGPDESHFNTSSSKSTWGIYSDRSAGKGFLSPSKRSSHSPPKEGDKLWFVKSKGSGLTDQLVAVATFTGIRERVLGPLLALTPTNEELGWIKTEGSWDTEVRYKDLYDLTHCNLAPSLGGSAVIRRYNDKCKVNLPVEYIRIVRELKTTNSM